MKTGHPSTRAVNSGSGNRALVTDLPFHNFSSVKLASASSIQTEISKFLSWNQGHMSHCFSSM